MTEKELQKVEEKVEKAFRDGKIMGMHLAGWSASLIAAELSMNASTVRSVIKKNTK